MEKNHDLQDAVQVWKLIFESKPKPLTSRRILLLNALFNYLTHIHPHVLENELDGHYVLDKEKFLLVAAWLGKSEEYTFNIYATSTYRAILSNLRLLRQNNIHMDDLIPASFYRDYVLFMVEYEGSLNYFYGMSFWGYNRSLPKSYKFEGLSDKSLALIRNGIDQWIENNPIDLTWVEQTGSGYRGDLGKAEIQFRRLSTILVLWNISIVQYKRSGNNEVILENLTLQTLNQYQKFPNLVESIALQFQLLEYYIETHDYELVRSLIQSIRDGLNQPQSLYLQLKENFKNIKQKRALSSIQEYKIRILRKLLQIELIFSLKTGEPEPFPVFQQQLEFDKVKGIIQDDYVNAQVYYPSFSVLMIYFAVNQNKYELAKKMIDVVNEVEDPPFITYENIRIVEEEEEDQWFDQHVRLLLERWKICQDFVRIQLNGGEIKELEDYISQLDPIIVEACMKHFRYLQGDTGQIHM